MLIHGVMEVKQMEMEVEAREEELLADLNQEQPGWRVTVLVFLQEQTERITRKDGLTFVFSFGTLTLVLVAWSFVCELQVRLDSLEQSLELSFPQQLKEMDEAFSEMQASPFDIFWLSKMLQLQVWLIRTQHDSLCLLSYCTCHVLAIATAGDLVLAFVPVSGAAFGQQLHVVGGIWRTLGQVCFCCAGLRCLVGG